MGMPRPGGVRGLGLVVAQVTACSMAWAATDAPLDTEPVLVTGSRLPELRAASTYSVGVIDADTATFERSARTFPDVLREEPSVMLQRTGNAQASPYIRGFTGFRTLLLIDGIRLNNSVFRDGPNQYWGTVDVLAIERTEVVRGPGAVLYGPDSIGGTVQAITPSRSGAGEPTADGRALYRYASAEDSHIGRLEGGADSGDVSVSLGGSIKRFGDVRGGSVVGVQPRTGYEEQDIDGKIQWRLKPGMELVLAHQTVDQDDAWRTHSTVQGLAWQGTRPGSNLARILDQDRSLTYVQWKATDLAPWLASAHASLSHQRQAEAEDRVRASRVRERQGFDVQTLGSFLTLESPSPVGRWVYGGDFYHDWVDTRLRRYNPDGSLALVDIQGPVADDASYDLAGVFAEDRIPLGSRVELSVGGRYTFAAARSEQVKSPLNGTRMSVDRSWNAAVGHLRGIGAINDGRTWHWIAGVSQSFRAPNLSDLTRFDIAEAGQLETPATQLSPEYFLTTEGGLRWTPSRVQAEATYYRTFLSDYIVRTPTGRTVNGLAEVTKRNAGQGWIQGVEVSGRVDLGHGFSLRGSTSWQEGELDSYPTSAPILVTEPVSRLMPWTGSLALRWEEPSRRRWWAEVLAFAAARQDRLASADKADTERIPPGGTPGYDVYTVRGGWRVNDRLGIALAVENLADRDYRVHGSGINEPGRNVWVTAECRF
ncbi:MAG: TonB-dependent receptor [Verrucomicrobiota bacterium]